MVSFYPENGRACCRLIACASGFAAILIVICLCKLGHRQQERYKPPCRVTKRAMVNRWQHMVALDRSDGGGSES